MYSMPIVSFFDLLRSIYMLLPSIVRSSLLAVILIVLFFSIIDMIRD